MKAFLNDEAVKNKYLTRVEAHILADELIKGKYWENGKGCAVGCTIHSANHNAYEIELGIPEWLARVEDTIFEGLKNDRAKTWPKDFLSVINTGADLDKIKGPFLIFVLESTLDTFDHVKFPDVKKSIDTVIALWKNPEATTEEFEAAAREAWEAWEARAVAAVAGAAAAAAYAARRSAGAAGAAREAAEYEKFADKLLELIRECK